MYIEKEGLFFKCGRICNPIWGTFVTMEKYVYRKRGTFFCEIKEKEHKKI